MHKYGLDGGSCGLTHEQNEESFPALHDDCYFNAECGSPPGGKDS